MPVQQQRQAGKLKCTYSSNYLGKKKRKWTRKEEKKRGEKTVTFSVWMVIVIFPFHFHEFKDVDEQSNSHIQVNKNPRYRPTKQKKQKQVHLQSSIKRSKLTSI